MNEPLRAHNSHSEEGGSNQPHRAELFPLRGIIYFDKIVEPAEGLRYPLEGIELFLNDIVTSCLCLGTSLSEFIIPTQRNAVQISHTALNYSHSEESYRAESISFRQVMILITTKDYYAQIIPKINRIEFSIII